MREPKYIDVNASDPYALAGEILSIIIILAATLDLFI